MGCGVSLYLLLPGEPRIDHLLVMCGVCAGAARFLKSENIFLSLCAFIIFCISLGVLVSAFRTHRVEAPILGWRFYGEIEGRIIKIDKSSAGAMRLTLDQLSLGRISKPHTPYKVRLSLYGPMPAHAPEVGQWIKTEGMLSPPQGPVEPGGFDFRIHAFFLGLGAVGYTRKAVYLSPAEENDITLYFAKARSHLSARIQAALPERTAGFAAAIITGDRSALAQSTVENLRQANLAHLLAISGLHMGLLVSLVLLSARSLLSCLPWFTLQRFSKQIVAAIALCAGSFYLGLSGGNIATQRAFIMASVMLFAVFLYRRAISLRSVALAAIIVLMLRPEMLISPGFQMSFAATTALVMVFRWWSAQPSLPKAQSRLWLESVFLSSFIAGLATAPYAAFHFNQFAHLGLIANLLSIPLMGALVIPSALLGLMMMPFGGEWIGFLGAHLGLSWILYVADTLAHTPISVTHIPSTAGMTLAILTLGLLFLVLWQGRSRHFGWVGVGIASLLWVSTERPDILISEHFSLVGHMTSQGRALSKDKSAQFIASVWMENDGRRISRDRASTLWRSDEIMVHHHWSKKYHTADIACREGEIHVTRFDHRITGPCIVLRERDYREYGSQALWLDQSGQIARHEQAMPASINHL